MKSGNYSPTFNKKAVSHELSLRHLYAEIALLDLHLQRQMAFWRATGQDPTDAFRGLYISDSEADGLMKRTLGGHWGDFADKDDTAFLEKRDAILSEIRAISGQAGAQGKALRFELLTQLLNLSEFEKQVLLLALAPALDLRYQRIYAYLQDDVTRKTPTVNMALELFSERRVRIRDLEAFKPDAPLYDSQILIARPSSEPLLTQTLQIDPSIPVWLLGHFEPDNLTRPTVEEANSLSAQSLVYNPEWIVAFTGPDRAAQIRAARGMAARMERPVLFIDLDSMSEGEAACTEVRRMLRNAILLGALPIIENWDAILKDDAPPTALFETIQSHPDMVVVCSKDPWRPRGARRTRRIRRVDFPVPSYMERLALWNGLLERHPEKTTLGISHLAGQFALTTGQIHDAFEAACDAAAQDAQPIQAGDLLAAARSHSNPRLGLLARKIDPRFGWEDIVLPREQLTILQEITATVRQRPKVLDEWGVGSKLASSRGVTVLFAGPPGTGKTMAAEIMAADLGLDLYKIDLSGVVSKYIGETEKNLEKVFEEAASSNAILFFDEADALFGKRSEVRDAHDRYANLEISYLLQRMEAYDGVTILATNLRANLDEAFTRRLQFAVDFPFPEEEDRLRIWRALLPPELPVDEQIDFTLLAQRFRIAGGNIRNVIINAAYLAAADGGVVTMAHMLHGTRRELQKMGRLLNEEDLVAA